MIIGYIEDDTVDAMIFERMLKQYSIVLYGSHQAYLESKISHDIVITDFQVPDRTDDNLKRSANKEDCPFVIYTGGCVRRLGKVNLDFYRNLGVSELFEKDKDNEALMEYVADIAKGIGE